jgi:hypothetical protein
MKNLKRSEVEKLARSLSNKYIAMYSKSSVRILRIAYKYTKLSIKRAKKRIP